jgi:hypothetical protein
MKTRNIILTMALVVGAGCLVWWTFTDRTSTPSTTEPSSVGSQKAAPGTSMPTTAPSASGKPSSPVMPKPAIDPAKMPETVRSIVDLQHNYRERLETARKLPPNLSSAELDALFAFLRERHTEDEDQGGHALKNDVMDALTQQEPLAPQIVALFVELYRDRNQHVVIRDYAVQHLSMAYERLIPSSEGKADGARTGRAEIAGYLWEALSETDSTIAGTALMGLNRISENTTELDRNRIAATAVKLAGDPGVGDAARISALQVGARLNNPETLPLSVKLLEGETPAGIRLSAIGAIGLLGSQRELPALNRIIEEGSPMLRPAATTAVGRIQQRLSGNTQEKL